MSSTRISLPRRGASPSSWSSSTSASSAAASMIPPLASSSSSSSSLHNHHMMFQNPSNRVYIHNYHDHARDPLLPLDAPREVQRGAARQFPTKLYEMLDASTSGAFPNFEEIVGWQSHGRCFIVRHPKRFVQEILPKFFSQSKLTSFQRQLALYGFARITKGQDRGAYYHEMFLRGRPDLVQCLKRTRVKGTGCKLAASPETEPDFYAMEVCPVAVNNKNEDNTSMATPPPTTEETDNLPTVTVTQEDGAGETETIEAVSVSESEEEDMASQAESNSSLIRRMESPKESNVTTQEVAPTLSSTVTVSPVLSSNNNSCGVDHDSEEQVLDPLEEMELNLLPLTAPSCSMVEMEAPASLPTIKDYTVSTITMPNTMFKAYVAPNGKAGPLKVPGRLQPSLESDSGNCITFVPLKGMDPAERATKHKKEFQRWLQPLRATIITPEIGEVATTCTDGDVSSFKTEAPTSLNLAAPAVPDNAAAVEIYSGAMDLDDSSLDEAAVSELLEDVLPPDQLVLLDDKNQASDATAGMMTLVNEPTLQIQTQQQHVSMVPKPQDLTMTGLPFPESMTLEDIMLMI